MMTKMKTKLEKPKQKRFIEPIKEFGDGDVIDLGKIKYAIKIYFEEKKSYLFS